MVVSHGQLYITPPIILYQRRHKVETKLGSCINFAIKVYNYIFFTKCSSSSILIMIRILLSEIVIEHVGLPFKMKY